MKKAFIITCIAVFLIALPLNVWLMYYHMFLADSFTLTTNYLDKMTYSQEEKFFIEVEMYPNTFGVKFNYYTDTNLPEKDEHGNYGEKYTYSSGVQFDGGYQYTRECKTDNFTYGIWYNKMTNCTYYNSTDSGLNFTAIKKLENENSWVYDIEGQLCQVQERGNVYSHNIAWAPIYNKYDTALMIQSLFKSVESFEDGVFVAPFDLSDYYHVLMYDGVSFNEDKFKTSEEYTIVNVKVTKSSKDLVRAQDSMFGRFMGDPDWSLYDFEEIDYWRSLTEYNLTIKDFTFVYQDRKYLLKLQNNAIEFLKEFKNMSYNVSIDLDNIYFGNEKIEVEGFSENAFGNLTIENLTLQAEENIDFNLNGNRITTIISSPNINLIEGGGE